MLLWQMWQIFFTFGKTGDCGKMIRRLMENTKAFYLKRQGVFLKREGVF